MKLIARLSLAAAVVTVMTVCAASTYAAPETWAGKISDAMCGADHGGQGGTMAKDHECTLACVRNGSQYIFVSDKDKKIFKIENQKFEGLPVHAGHGVLLTGELKDGSITVSKIEMPKAK